MEGEDEDVLQLLTGEDEFDADIDEDAEEELLREDSVSDSNRKHLNSFENQSKSMEDEDEDDDRDSSRRGRFRSERIMSLASVPTRRREIPDNLESVDVNLIDNNSNKNNYNNRRNINNSNNNNNQQNYRHFKQNSNNNSQNQRQHSYRLPINKSLLPLPNQSMGQPSHTQQQRMVLMAPNIYGQQMANNSNPMNTIHVNPHFRARLNNQFDQISHGVRPQQNSDQQMRLPMNVMIQQRGQYPNQPINNSQQMLFNPQINNQFRPHFIQNNSLFNDQNIQQMAPQLQQQQQQPLLPHPQQSIHHQMQMDTEWRPISNDSGFQMAPNMMSNMSPNMAPHMAQQHMIGQQMSQQMNRQMSPMLGPTQSNFNNNYDRFGANYTPNQPLMMSVNGMAQYPVANNFGHSFQQPMETQRFSVPQNFNKMGFNSQPTVDTNRFQNPPNHPMIPNNININQSKQINPMLQQKPINNQKRVNQPFQAQVRPNRPLNITDQKSEAIKTAQMKTKRAKQLLTKKQSVVKEVRIVKNTNTVPIEYKGQTKENKELEAVVGVDDEYKRKLEEQKRLREEILRKKEERRKAMAAQRLRETESKSYPNPNQKVIEQKSSPVRCQAQQIATLLNRSPQPTNAVSKPLLKRIVKPVNEKSIPSKPSISRMVVVNSNQNQKRSVLIKGLAASTTEQTIRKLCKPIGAIESCKIIIIGGQKSANVTFVRTQDAIQFQSKYERTLLDLSIIQVSLIWFVLHIFIILFSHLTIIRKSRLTVK